MNTRRRRFLALGGGAVVRPLNLLVQSQDFGTTWANTASVDDLNATTAPDGTTTADRLIDDSAGGTGNVGYNQDFTAEISKLYTFSCFLKADQLSWARLMIQLLGSVAINSYFNLTTGAVGGTPGANNLGQGTINAGNGWLRCWIAGMSDAVDTSGTVTIRCADADNDQTVDRDGTSSIFVWGAQLNGGLRPQPYRPTTTAAIT